MINSIGMFILQIQVWSNDNQYHINSTSNYIRIVSPNITDNSDYYYNLQLQFNGTFIPSQQNFYVTTIYNYFLTKYNAELIGPFFCYSGSVMFVAGLDQSNSTMQASLVNGTINDANYILPGYPLTWFLLGTYEVNFTSKDSIYISVTSQVGYYFYFYLV